MKSSLNRSSLFYFQVVRNFAFTLISQYQSCQSDEFAFIGVYAFINMLYFFREVVIFVCVNRLEILFEGSWYKNQ